MRGLASLRTTAAIARARQATRQAARRLSASSSSASAASLWAPRLALVALPIGTGAALYVWRNWPDGEGGRDGLSTRWEDDDMIPRAKFERRYKLVKSLGKGGFGEVWLAVEKGSGKKVAVKVLSLKQLPRAMVEQEITAMRRCGRHPNVVALLDAVWIAPDDENPCARHSTRSHSQPQPQLPRNTCRVRRA